MKQFNFSHLIQTMDYSEYSKILIMVATTPGMIDTPRFRNIVKMQDITSDWTRTF